MKDDASLGRIIQHAAMPAASGMDAVEARLVVVQEVPSKAEVRFYAVRGEVRERMPTAAALAVLREHIPQRPIDNLSDVELLMEVSVLRTEVSRMRPTYEAAKAWREHREACPGNITADDLLIVIVDAAIAVEKAST